MLSHVTRICFGRAIPEGGTVSGEEWQAFQHETLAAHFPDGFTVIEASGGWRDTQTDETIEEPSVIVEVAHDGSAEALAAIRSVATVYKVLFRQQAVMVATVPATVDFI